VKFLFSFLSGHFAPFSAEAAKPPGGGREYFVNLQGSDENNGLPRAEAFRTIQKGVSALAAGDTLTIGPGEYFENVKRDKLGFPDRDTMIRAEIPGTVILRGDVPAPSFRKVPGYRFVFAASFDALPLAVLEHDTLITLSKRPNVRDVEFDPGSFHYDEDKKILSISTSDLREPGQRRYTVAVIGKSGIDLGRPRRVIIEGLAATGFFPGWGVSLTDPVGCVVRKCVTCLDAGGITLAVNATTKEGGSNNVVEECVTYGHTFVGMMRYGSHNDIIRNCYAYKSKVEGIAHYAKITGPFLLKNNISWGHPLDYSIKSGTESAQQFGLVQDSVALGNVRNMNKNCVIGGGNEHDRTRIGPADCILFQHEANLDNNREFADPDNMDFRLQADSRFRGTGPDGKDRGAYPYHKNIFYISQEGRDENDGLSLRTPWRTLGRAVKRLRPGDTLYLEAGVYADGLKLRAGRGGAEKIHIRGRGRAEVVISGRVDVVKSVGVEFERLHFVDGVTVSECQAVAFNNCTFSGVAGGLKVREAKDFKVTHGVFADVSLELDKANGVYLAGNIYANPSRDAVRMDTATRVSYSDYNSYQDASRCWLVDGVSGSLAEMQKQHDRYSMELKPEFVKKSGVPHLNNLSAFRGRGPHSTSLGIYLEFSADALGLQGPYLHSVSETTANLEWWTSSPATLELAWGETPDMTNTVRNLKAPDCYTPFSLTGLKPGQKYYFQIRSADASGSRGPIAVPVLFPETPPLVFTTLLSGPPAAVYYVAPDGDDASNGLSRAQAWRTVNHAADRVTAGDTVLIAGGTYNEKVRIRATGEEGKPITFRSIPGEKVVFQGADLDQAVSVIAKKNIRFDGFYFVGWGDSSSAIFVLWQGDQTQITRCFHVKGGGNVGFLSAEYSADVWVKNCVAAKGFVIAQFHVCPRWRMENNLFLGPWISAVSFVDEPDQKGFLRNNIITDNLPYKVKQPLISVGRFESFVEGNNCYFLRVPDDQRKVFQFYGTAAYGRYAPIYGVNTNFATPPVFVDNKDGTENNPRLSVKEYQAMVGDTGSFAGDPKFAGTANMPEGGKLWTGDPSTMFDKLGGKEDVDFPDTFATSPEAVKKQVGPQPDAFKDFWFNNGKGAP
jgi:hypothetical protein